MDNPACIVMTTASTEDEAEALAAAIVEARPAACVRVSQINGCAYCLDMHTRDLSKKDVPVQKLALVQVWQEAGDLFSDREQAALAWAESVTRVPDTHVPDEAFEAAAAVFGEKELADLTMAIGLMNAFNRLAISFRRGPEAAQAAKG